MILKILGRLLVTLKVLFIGEREINTCYYVGRVTKQQIEDRGTDYWDDLAWKKAISHIAKELAQNGIRNAYTDTKDGSRVYKFEIDVANPHQKKVSIKHVI